jgi:hypothetical protein
VVAEAFELDEPEHLGDLALPRLARATGELERQRDVLGDCAPVVEHGVLEDDSVVAVDTCPARGLAVHHDASAARLDQVADDAEQVDFPHPDGPISETNSPGSISRSMSCSALERVVLREVDDRAPSPPAIEDGASPMIAPTMLAVARS